MEFLKKLFQFLFGWLSTPDTPPIDDDNDDITDTDTNDGEDDVPTGIERFPYRSAETDAVGLEAGFEYTIGAADAIEDTNTLSFEQVAEHHGMHSTSLREFNKGEIYRVGDMVYIPSVDELCFAEYCRHYGDLDAAVAAYMEMPLRPNRAMLNAARYRGAGEIGAKYATTSVVFYSPNGALAGANESRSDMINGQREYRVNWGTDIWKCNVFMHDCTFHTGFEPDVRSSNKHYIKAGELHFSEKFGQINIEDLTPGCVVQLFGGVGSDDSHNMVLMSFMERKAIDEPGLNVEEWTFKGMGAEKNRVAVSVRRHFVITDRDEEENGYKVYKEYDLTKRTYIRLFRPLYDRNEVV